MTFKTANTYRVCTLGNIVTCIGHSFSATNGTLKLYETYTHIYIYIYMYIYIYIQTIKLVEITNHILECVYLP